MDKIITFLEDNYVYVAGIGLVLIIILIGFISSRRKGKITKEDKSNMANLNDVHTGEINQVADTLKQNEMKPVDVAPAPINDALKVEQGPVTPVVEEVAPVEIPTPATPITPIVNDQSEKFDKTEVIDFSAPVNLKPEAPDTMLHGEESTAPVNDQNNKI